MLWVQWFFLSFRNKVAASYPAIFGEGNGEFGDFSEQNQFNKQWGWYNTVYQLAQGDVRRFDEVTKIRLATALTYLSYESQKAKLEAKLIKKSYNGIL